MKKRDCGVSQIPNMLPNSNVTPREGQMMNRKEIFEKIIQVLKSQGAKKIAVFGSYTRGEEKAKSDIDIIVEFSERKSLLELVKI